MKEFFNRFADKASTQVAKGWFFSLCVLIILIWAPSYFLFGNIDTWQLVINTTTTIVTFLLVALLQNAQERFEMASHKKNDAHTVALVRLLKHYDLPHEDVEDTIGIEKEVQV